MEVAEPSGLERVTVHYQQQQDGSVLVRAVDALTFLREHPLLIGARLNLVRTQVRDTESTPYLVVTPTTGVAPPPRTGGSRKRRVDDRKQLTPLGLEAAQRDKRPVKGGLTKDSILWRLVNECCGGVGCTPRPGRSTGCELEVHCTATADQILNGDYVRVRLIKQHCADGSWVPPQPGPDPAKQAELTQALQAVQELRVEKGVCEARIARGGAMSAGAGSGAAAAAAAGRSSDTIGAEIRLKLCVVKQLRDENRPHHQPEERDAILRYTADGHGPTMTQQLMQQQLRQVDPTSPAASLEVPTVRYIQGVQGNSKRIWSNSLGPYDSTEKINDLLD